MKCIIFSYSDDELHAPAPRDGSAHRRPRTHRRTAPGSQPSTGTRPGMTDRPDTQKLPKHPAPAIPQPPGSLQDRTASAACN